mgnify:CR=1 FL=1|jgi:hypothetical protein
MASALLSFAKEAAMSAISQDIASDLGGAGEQDLLQGLFGKKKKKIDPLDQSMVMSQQAESIPTPLDFNSLFGGNRG